jgi:uncharacterized protein YbjQ (UPF0145 family)
MQVNAQVDLDEGNCAELSKILGCRQEELEAMLAPFASAAIHEYVSMFLGQKVFSRGSDINEYRLFLLITKALGNHIPDEASVCRLFQTTTSESRALIRAVMSKYQYLLREAVDSTMQGIIDAAKQDEADGNWGVIVNNQNIVDELNRLLASIDGSLQPMAKRRGSVSTYEISPSSYERLKQRLAQRG